jgi:hypothetical protein
LSVDRFDRSRFEIRRNYLGHLYIDVGIILEDVPQRKRRIARRQHGRGDLIEQRLELLIIVFVDQRDPDIRTRRQFAGTVQPSKTASDDNDVLHAKTSCSTILTKSSGESSAIWLPATLNTKCKDERR